MSDANDGRPSTISFSLTVHGDQNTIAQGHTVNQVNVVSAQDVLKRLEAFRAELGVQEGVPAKARADLDEVIETARRGHWDKAKAQLAAVLAVLAVTADLTAVTPVLHEKGAALVQMIGSLPK